MKIHLAYSDEPLESGKDLYAICGTAISRAYFAFYFDLGFDQAAHLKPFMVCGDCYAHAATKHKYLYGVVNGQDSMTEAIQ